VSGKVSIRVVDGPLKRSVLTYEEHDTVVFGRAKDCHGRLPKDDGAVSRHHFLLEVNPPQARVRDLGSRHGTFVNGTKYGGRAPDERVEDAAGRSYPQVDLKHGDEIRAGRTTFAVEIEGEEETVPAGCSRCGRAVPAGSTSVPPLCPACAAPSKSARGDESSRIIPGYEIVRRIGVGGMGAVYLARRERDAVWVALKLMLAKIAVNENARVRFLRESSIVEQLVHPNIVSFYERGSEGPSFYFTMEFCPGGSLGDLLARRGGKLPVEEACAIALQILDALAYAHERRVAMEMPDGRSVQTRGVVHRDIKPMNVLLTGAERRWTAKLSDFGLAKCFQMAGLSGCTVTGDAAGALPYMPREQLLDFKNVLPVSDVWSMGATLYEMLVGSAPRDMPKERDPLAVILGGKTVPVLERDPSIPVPIAEVVERALRDDPVERYGDAREFRDALVAALSAEHHAEDPTAETRLEGGASTPTPTASEAAVAAFDLAWRDAAPAGETWTAGRVRQLREALAAHPKATSLLYVRASGEGVVAVFADVATAVEVAQTLRLAVGDRDVPLRRVVHWGALRFGPAGEPLGDEVRRAMLLRATSETDRKGRNADTQRLLPRSDRVVVTRAALDQLPAPARRSFVLVGRFRVPGFEDGAELWCS
jgi:serine/threonine protein kinase